MYKYVGPCKEAGLTREMVEKALTSDLDEYSTYLTAQATPEVRIAMYKLVAAYELCCVKSNKNNTVGIFYIPEVDLVARALFLSECCYCHKDTGKDALITCNKCFGVMYCPACLEKHGELECAMSVQMRDSVEPFLVPCEMCANCGKQEELKSCSACRHIVYCSRPCQREDWKKFHKVECHHLNQNKNNNKTE